MQSNYIVRTNDNKLHAFYYISETGIQTRIYENNKWQPPHLLAPLARENYSISLSKNGDIYVFVQERSGDIQFYKKNSDSEWVSENILKHQSPIVQPMLFYSIITEHGLSFVYNTPISDDRMQFLVTQKLDNSKNWSTPSRVDKIVNLPNALFHPQMVSDSHSIVFYSIKTPETSVGYREFTYDKSGNFNLIHATNYTLSDYSFLTTTDSIYTLFLLKGIFSSQLVFRKKTSVGFSSPVVIWEGQRLNNCLLYIIKGDLHASFMANGRLFVCSSFDMGDTFQPAIRYKFKFCPSPIKAIYISAINDMKESDYFCREVYVDSQNPYDIQILPEMCEDFFPYSQKSISVSEAETVKSHEIESVSIPDVDKKQPVEEQNQYQDVYDPFAGMSFPKQDKHRQSSFAESQSSEIIADLKDELSIIKKQLAEKDRQIAQLMKEIEMKVVDVNESVNENAN